MKKIGLIIVLAVILNAGLVAACGDLEITYEPKTVHVKVFTQCMNEEGKPIDFEANRAINTKGDVGDIFFPVKGDCYVTLFASTKEGTVLSLGGN